MSARSAPRLFQSGARRFGATNIHFGDFDGYMLVTTLVLIAFGTIAISSASGADVNSLQNPGVRQALLALVGLAISFMVATIDYRFFASASWVAYSVGVALLGLVLVPGIGTELQGGRRWFDLGFITVQPSEFAKLTTMLALAAFASSRGDAMKQFGNFLLSLAIAGLPMALVMAEPDFDSAIMFVVIWVSVLFVSRPKPAHVAALVALTPVVLLFAYVFLLREFHRDRIKAFLGLVDDPLGVSYQSTQAEISIGSGGWFGYGLGGGTPSQLDLLSVRTSDFVFAHASSMFGFVGMLALFACFVILLLRVLRVAEISSDSFGQCMAIGIGSLLLVQAVVNISMNLGLLPVVGSALPFVSAGVSSLWTFLIAEGILQSILMHHRKLAFQRD